MTIIEQPTATWHPVCSIGRLTADRGVAAYVDRTPLALFLLSTGDLHAIDNIDPCSGANVLSRGLVGDVGGTPTVASPMYKQRFDLRSGDCLDDPTRRVAVHAARVVDGIVQVAVTT